MALMKRMIEIYFGTKKPYNDLENKYLKIGYIFFTTHYLAIFS